jgi:large subunit ribosomal protein L16
MGKGAGKVTHLICNVSPGDVIFTLKGVNSSIGIRALQLATKKLPVRSVITGNI